MAASGLSGLDDLCVFSFRNFIRFRVFLVSDCYAVPGCLVSDVYTAPGCLVSDVIRFIFLVSDVIRFRGFRFSVFLSSGLLAWSEQKHREVSRSVSLSGSEGRFRV